MKILGLDVGEKRIGVAVADTDVKIAVPLTTVSTEGDEINRLQEIMEEEGTNLVVVGLPRNSKGIETAQSEIVRIFATQLQAQGARVKFQDESLTSVEAERRLKLRNKRYDKGDIDKEAAAIILQDFIESRSGQMPERVTEGARPEDAERPEPTRGRRGERKAKFPFVSVLVVVLVACLSGGVIWFAAGSGPVDGNMLRQVFVVEQGETTAEIGRNLEEAGLVRSADVFTLAARLSGANIQADTYFLSSRVGVWGIIEEVKQ